MRYESKNNWADFDIFSYLMESNIEIWQILLICFQILVIENPPNNLIFKFAIFKFTFWAIFASEKKADKKGTKLLWGSQLF